MFSLAAMLTLMLLMPFASYATPDVDAAADAARCTDMLAADFALMPCRRFRYFSLFAAMPCRQDAATLLMPCYRD